MTKIDYHKKPNHKNGFVLIMVAGIMIVLGVVLLKTFPVSSDIKLKNVTKTYDKLLPIKRALLVYYETNGELPCPSDNTLAMNDANFGVADCGATGVVDNDPVFEGGIPFKDIKIPASYAYDDWSKRFTYVMDSSYTDYIEGGDNIIILNNAGTDVTGANGGVIPQFMGLIISHGKDGSGALGMGRTSVPAIENTCSGNENCNGDLTFLKNAWTATNDDLVEYLTPCPGAVNGCSLWLDAGSDVVDTISIGTSLNWDDKSGNGLPAIRTSASLRPDTGGDINGRRALTFDGSNNMNTNSPVFETSENSIFVVARQTDSAWNDMIGTGSITDGDILMSHYADKFGVNIWSNTTQNLAQSTGDAFDYPTLYNQGVDTSKIYNRRNGYSEDETTIVDNKVESEKRIYLGSRDATTTRGFEGDIGEVVVYDQNLSEENRTRVSCEMARKWGTFPREGLQLWLDATDVDGNNDGDVGDPSDGDDMGGAGFEWVSKVGSYVAAQTDSARRPTYQTSELNGKPVIQFVGNSTQWQAAAADDQFLQISSVSSADIAQTFIVFRRGNKNQPVIEHGDNYDRGMAGNVHVNYAMYDEYSINGASYVSAAPDSAAGADYYIVSGKVLEATTSDFWRIGFGKPVYYNLNGAIAEIISYNRELSEEERRITECYLSGKWGIGISYPSAP